MRWPVGSGLHPRWGNDSSLYYVRGSELMKVAVSTSPTPSFGEPELVLEIGDAPVYFPRYDISDDGRIAYVEISRRRQPLILMQNWHSEIFR